jgi:hypothetical protein
MKNKMKMWRKLGLGRFFRVSNNTPRHMGGVGKVCLPSPLLSGLLKRQAYLG